MSLELNRVALTIGGRPLVKQVSLSLQPGEVVGLLGPNGAGKTTTFNLVTGLLRPDSGDVVMNGASIADLSMPLRAREGIGYLPQEASVFRNLSVRDNLLLALQESGLPGGAAPAGRAPDRRLPPQCLRPPARLPALRG